MSEPNDSGMDRSRRRSQSDRDQSERDLERTVDELRYIVVGLDGENGLRSRVAAVERLARAVPQQIAEEVEKLRVLIEEREAVRQREHRSIVRFSIAMGVTVVCALISALAIVLSSTGHG